MNEIKCKMKIDRIMYPKDREIETGEFAIFTARVIEHMAGEKPVEHSYFNTVSLKGNVPHLKEKEVFTITFGDKEENKFGVSYKVNNVTKEIDPNNKEELKEYYNFICGRQIAAELIKVENSYDLLINKNDSELLKIKGIGEAKLKKIYENIDTYSDKSYAYTKLIPLGLTKKMINNICFGVGGSAAAVEMCYNNPYELIKKVKGISFIIADQIALKCGYCNIEKRIASAIVYILELAGEDGKSYLTASQLITELKTIASVEFHIVDKVVRQLSAEKTIQISQDGMQVALVKYVKLEQALANRFLELSNAQSVIEIPGEWRNTVKEIEESQGWSYTEEQLEAMKLVLENNVVVISGKAGCGKTSVTNAICKVLEEYDISMCCLAAKAAQRLSQVSGYEAKTIHRMLGLGLDGTTDNEIYADIIIVDEASMINGTLFLKLIEAIKLGAKLIILGDDGQLTSIGNCSVFSDLMNNKKICHIELTQIHRQAKKSAIITKSIAIRNQQEIYEKGFYGHRVLGELEDLELFVEKDSSNLLQLVKAKFMEDYKTVGNILEVQVITALKTRGALCTQQINLEIQKMVNILVGETFEGNNKTRIYLNDKVINLKNNYSCKTVEGRNISVFNGSIGIVKKIDAEEVLIDFTGIGCVVINKNHFQYINLAYAISCHSSQGSQWERVICAFDMSSYILLNVELLYTAVTRAISNCSLVIEDCAMQHALRTIEQKTKQTFLRGFLEKA